MKKTKSIILLVFVSILLAGCLVFLFLILGTHVFFKDNKANTDNEQYEPVVEVVNTKGAIDLEIEYTGGPLYEGGRAVAENFSVYMVKNSGKKVKVNKFKCTMIDEKKPLKLGTNTFVFNYGNLSKAINLEAVSPTEGRLYAPTYCLGKIDVSSAQEVIDKINNKEMTFEEALSDIAFTGDSQIAALISYRITTNKNVEALVGSSTEYLEKMFDTVVAKAYGKKALIVHYGINSLSSNAAERARRIEHYKGLLSDLKELLPGTRIIVSGVFPVSNTIINTKSSFAYINEYNFDLLKMCMELDIEYYSNNEYMANHQEVFSGDGLHLTPAFYKEYWVYDLMKTMGL